MLLLSITLITLLSFTCIKTSETPFEMSSIAEFEKYLNELTGSGIPQGLSFVVVRNRQIVYQKGFGWADQPRKIPARPETVYHWWSCTKIVTAMAILQLREKGKLDLNDQVIKYLPFLKIKYPSENSKPVTILNLLNHSSGLPDPGFRIISWIHHEDEPALNQTKFLKDIFHKYSKLKFEPGESTSYTNIGYIVLGAIIEKVTGQTYEDYIRQNILQPLRMDHTDFMYTKAMEPNEASGSNPVLNIYTVFVPFICRSFVREVSNKHIWLERVYTDQTPSTALIGPATDAARLIIAYMNKGELDGQRILSEESINLMTHEGHIKGIKEDSSQYIRQGIGWQVYGGSDYWLLKHTGGGLGFFTEMTYNPGENTGFVVFTNDYMPKLWKITKMAAKIEW